MKKLVPILTIVLISFQAMGQQRLTQVRTMEDVLNETYCSPVFNTRDGVYFDMLDRMNNASAMSYQNILDWLQGRVSGLQILNGRDNRRIPYIRNQQAAVYVDEMRMDYGYLNLLPIADIAMIKVIKGPFIGGWGAAGGAIAIYTIRGDEDEE